MSPALIKLLPLLFVSVFVMPAVGHAADLGDQSRSVFKFQQKLADNDNPQAQYKLARMYESGTGVDQDLDQARHWYTQASNGGNKSASDRITFLTVKQEGFQKDKHSRWLDGVKEGAANDDTEALILLGQMYRKGIGVDKDLNKSLELLMEVNSSGRENVDREVLAVRSEITAEKAVEKTSRAAAVARAKQVEAREKAAVQQARADQTQTIVDEKAQAAQQKAEKERLLEEKKQRYEAVMAQIRKEQEMLKAQQASVSGQTIAVDEEF